MKLDVKHFLDRLRSLARIQNAEVIREELEGLMPADLAEGIQRLSVAEGLNLLRKLDDETAAQILIEIPTELARLFVAELPDSTLAFYLDILPMDDALELREEVGEERFDALLEVIPREDALEIRRLLAYPEESVGRLLTEDFFEVAPEASMTEILADIRQAPEGKYETVNDIYVLDEDKHLAGVFSLRMAIRAAPEATARDVMIDDIITCAATDPAEDVARQIARYGFYAMPVLDDRGRMLGIFTVDDAQEIVSEADTEDVLKLGAVSGDAEAYLSLGVFQLVKRRLPWLLALFVAETFTGSVMRHYGQTDDSLNLSPLTFFIPLLIGAGGNSGSQVTTTITRALALGEVRASDWLTVIRREFVTALIVGAVLGVLGCGRAFFPSPFGWHSGVSLSLTVGLALPAIVIWATTIGSMLPIAAKSLRIDPAVMSAPFITTFVDATGLIIYFEIARAVIG
ncbi:MAG: magnesium transporter [Fimbriimonadaceae bacterium]|nr:magnesium transporter [Fimbriimonadaceae bacterium]